VASFSSESVDSAAISGRAESMQSPARLERNQPPPARFGPLRARARGQARRRGKGMNPSKHFLKRCA
jgi:hypothetical protein